MNKNNSITRKNQLRLYDLSLMEGRKIKPDPSFIIIDLSLKKIICKKCKKEKLLVIDKNEIGEEARKVINLFKQEHKNCK